MTPRTLLYIKLQQAFAPYVGNAVIDEATIDELKSVASQTVEEFREELGELRLPPIAVNIWFDQATNSIRFTV